MILLLTQIIRITHVNNPHGIYYLHLIQYKKYIVRPYTSVYIIYLSNTISIREDYLFSVCFQKRVTTHITQPKYNNKVVHERTNTQHIHTQEHTPLISLINVRYIRLFCISFYNLHFV